MKVFCCSQLAAMGRVSACSLAMAMLLGASVAGGDQLTPEVTGPLVEFREKRLAIQAKAAADTAKELQVLIRKLEKLSKIGGKSPKVSEEATAILKQIEDLESLDPFTIDRLVDFDGGVSGQQAQAINLAYMQGLVTAEYWAKLPGEALKVNLFGKGTGIDVQPGDFVLICPHPDQKWRHSAGSSWTTFDGKPGNHHLQVMVATIISDKNPEPHKLTREKGVLFECRVAGRLHLGSPGPRRGAEGAIECKVFKITAR
jgi:hypothetical protein